MKADRIVKTLLVLIAIGLWINALNPWLLPTRVSAQSALEISYLSSIDSHLSEIVSYTYSIESDASSIESYLGRIQRGTCSNSTICD